MENFKSMYPREIRMIQSYVSEACDRMDYQNSPMYDEWPEQRMVDQMCNSVCADFFHVDATVMRLLMLFLIIFGGLSIWAYIILWIIIPEQPAPKFNINRKNR